MSAYNNYSGFGYSYPYGNYYQPQGQPQQNYNVGNQPPQMQQNPQPQVQQTSYIPLTYVSGLIGAKSFIVAPNHTVYLRDSDEGSDLLFEKSADVYGKYTLKAFRMVPVNLEDNNKQPQENQKQTQSNNTNLDKFATKDDLKEFKTLFENKLDDLSSLLQKSIYKGKNNNQIKDSGKNE